MKRPKPSVRVQLMNQATDAATRWAAKRREMPSLGEILTYGLGYIAGWEAEKAEAKRKKTQEN